MYQRNFLNSKVKIVQEKDKEELKRLKELVFPKSSQSHGSRHQFKSPDTQNDSVLIPKRTNVSMEMQSADYNTVNTENNLYNPKRDKRDKDQHNRSFDAQSTSRFNSDVNDNNSSSKKVKTNKKANLISISRSPLKENDYDEQIETKLKLGLNNFENSMKSMTSKVLKEKSKSALNVSKNRKGNLNQSMIDNYENSQNRNNNSEKFSAQTHANTPSILRETYLTATQVSNEVSKFMQKLVMTMIQLSNDEDSETQLKQILRKYILAVESFRVSFDRKDPEGDPAAQLAQFKKVFLKAFEEVGQKFTSLMSHLQNNPDRMNQARQRGLQNIVKNISEEFHKIHFIELLPALSYSIKKLRLECGLCRVAKTFQLKLHQIQSSAFKTFRHNIDPYFSSGKGKKVQEFFSRVESLFTKTQDKNKQNCFYSLKFDQINFINNFNSTIAESVALLTPSFVENIGDQNAVYECLIRLGSALMEASSFSIYSLEGADWQMYTITKNKISKVKYVPSEQFVSAKDTDSAVAEKSISMHSMTIYQPIPSILTDLVDDKLVTTQPDHKINTNLMMSSSFQQKIQYNLCTTKMRLISKQQSQYLTLLRSMNTRFNSILSSSLTSDSKNNILNIMNSSLSLFMQTIDQMNTVDSDQILHLAQKRLTELLKCNVNIWVVKREEDGDGKGKLQAQNSYDEIVDLNSSKNSLVQFVYTSKESTKTEGLKNTIVQFPLEFENQVFAILQCEKAKDGVKQSDITIDNILQDKVIMFMKIVTAKLESPNTKNEKIIVSENKQLSFDLENMVQKLDSAEQLEDMIRISVQVFKKYLVQCGYALFFTFEDNHLMYPVQSHDFNVALNYEELNFNGTFGSKNAFSQARYANQASPGSQSRFYNSDIMSSQEFEKSFNEKDIKNQFNQTKIINSKKPYGKLNDEYKQTNLESKILSYSELISLKSKEDIIRIKCSDLISSISDSIIINRNQGITTTNFGEKVNDEFVNNLFRLTNDRPMQSLLLQPVFLQGKLQGIIAVVTDRSRQNFMDKDANVLKFITSSLEIWMETRLKFNQVNHHHEKEVKALQAMTEEKDTLCRINEFLNTFMVKNQGKFDNLEHFFGSVGEFMQKFLKARSFKILMCQDGELLQVKRNRIYILTDNLTTSLTGETIVRDNIYSFPTEDTLPLSTARNSEEGSSGKKSTNLIKRIRQAQPKFNQEVDGNANQPDSFLIGTLRSNIPTSDQPTLVIQLFNKEVGIFDPGDVELFSLLMAQMRDMMLEQIENWKKRQLVEIETQAVNLSNILRRLVEKRRQLVLSEMKIFTNDFGVVNGKIKNLKAFKQQNEAEFLVSKLSSIVNKTTSAYFIKMKEVKQKKEIWGLKCAKVFNDLNKILKIKLRFQQGRIIYHKTMKFDGNNSLHGNGKYSIDVVRELRGYRNEKQGKIIKEFGVKQLKNQFAKLSKGIMKIESKQNILKLQQHNIANILKNAALKRVSNALDQFQNHIKSKYGVLTKLKSIFYKNLKNHLIKFQKFQKFINYRTKKLNKILKLQNNIKKRQVFYKLCKIVNQFKNELMTCENEKVLSLSKTLEVVSEEISLLSTIGVLTQALIHKKYNIKQALVSEEFKTIASEVNSFLGKLLNCTQVTVWFSGFDMFQKQQISSNCHSQVFKSEEIINNMISINNEHQIDSINFIEKSQNILFEEISKSGKVHKCSKAVEMSQCKVGKSFIPRSFMLVPVTNRAKKKNNVQIILDFSFKSERTFSEDDEWMVQNFALKSASVFQVLLEQLGKVATEDLNTPMVQESNEAKLTQLLMNLLDAKPMSIIKNLKFIDFNCREVLRVKHFQTIILNSMDTRAPNEQASWIDNQTGEFKVKKVKGTLYEVVQFNRIMLIPDHHQSNKSYEYTISNERQNQIRQVPLLNSEGVCQAVMEIASDEESFKRRLDGTEDQKQQLSLENRLKDSLSKVLANHLRKSKNIFSTLSSIVLSLDSKLKLRTLLKYKMIVDNVKSEDKFSKSIMDCKKEQNAKCSLQEEILSLNDEKQKQSLKIEDARKLVDSKKNEIYELDKALKTCLNQNKASNKFLGATLLMKSMGTVDSAKKKMQNSLKVWKKHVSYANKMDQVQKKVLIMNTKHMEARINGAFLIIKHFCKNFTKSMKFGALRKLKQNAIIPVSTQARRKTPKRQNRDDEFSNNTNIIHQQNNSLNQSNNSTSNLLKDNIIKIKDIPEIRDDTISVKDDIRSQKDMNRDKSFENFNTKVNRTTGSRFNRDERKREVKTLKQQ